MEKKIKIKPVNMFLILVSLISLLSLISCKGNLPNTQNTNDLILSNIDSTLNQNIQNNTNSNTETYLINDSINSSEHEILNLISTDNESFFYTKNVTRFYSKSDSALLFSKFLFNKDILYNNGYIWFNIVEFGSELDGCYTISYSYSKGQASTCIGSVIISDENNYIHSLRSCGLTSCIIQLFENGKKIYEK